MNGQLNGQSRSMVSIVGVLGVGLAAIYLIPFHVPVDGWSVSYIFGFNNRAALGVFIAFALGFAIWARGLGLQLPQPDTIHSSFRRTRNLALVLTVLGCVAVWILSLPFAAMGEAQYFLDRYEMLHAGGTIYRDFTFDYGPLMFYPPVWIARLCHISLANAHYAAWILQWILGTWILWKVIATAAAGTRHGRSIFLLCWGFFLTALTDSGPNYTPLRFAATLGFGLWVFALYRRGAPLLLTFGVAALGVATLLFYSPEQGLAFLAGTMLFFLFCVRPLESRAVTGLALLALVTIGILWVGLKVGVLNNIRTVGGGSLNLPLIFSYQTAVLILLLIAASCVLIASFRLHQSGHPLVYLICLSIVSLPAAFSHADVGHIIINTLGALIAALVVLSQYRTAWQWTLPLFAIALVLTGYGHLHGYPDWFRAQARAAAFGERCHSPSVEKIYTKFIHATKSGGAAEARIRNLRAEEAIDDDPAAPHLPKGTHFFAPMGVERRIATLQDHPEILSGQYASFPFITSPAFVDEKIAELKSHSGWPILLPSNLQCTEVKFPILRAGVKEVLFVPYMPTPKHQMNVVTPFCDYVRAYYVPTNYFSPTPRTTVWVPTENRR